MRVCLVTARKDSQRLPGKNRLTVGGIPLWERAARFGAQTGWRVVVDSDDGAILEAAWLAGYAIHPRATPREAEGGTHKQAIYDAARWAGASSVLLLQPTSPFRDLTALAGLVDGFDGSASHLTTQGQGGASLGLTGWDGNLMLFDPRRDYDSTPSLLTPLPAPYGLEVDYEGNRWEAERLCPTLPNAGLF